MKFLLKILLLCAILAVFKAAVIALVAALLLALIVSFVTQPRGTLVLLATLGLLGLASARPVVSIITLGVVALGVAVACPKREPQGPESPRLLTDQRDDA